MKKRLLALALTICTLSVMLCACSEENKKKESEKQPKADTQQTTTTAPDAKPKKEPKEEPVSKELPQWAKIYTDFIVENAPSAEEIGSFHGFCYLGVNDLNFDGVPELIISSDAVSAANAFAICHIENDTVEKLCGDSSFLEDPSEIEGELKYNGISFYTLFNNDWLTVRKNVNTGEIKYIMYTHNGASNEEFGNIVSFGAGENREIEVVNEFEYLLLYDDSGQLSEKNYYVSGKSVTEEEYNEAVEEFEKTWIDTGVRTCAMASDSDEYSNKLPVSIERKDLETLFRNYEKEF